MRTFACLQVALLDEIWHSSTQLEDDAHRCASSNDDLIALWLLDFGLPASSRGLIVQLLFPGADLGRCRELIQKRNGCLVVVCRDARLR